jgi:hypothetical protein
MVDIDMVKEVGPHEAMIGLWMGFGESHVLVHVEGHHMLETNFTSLDIYGCYIWSYFHIPVLQLHFIENCVGLPCVVQRVPYKLAMALIQWEDQEQRVDPQWERTH